MIEELKKEIDSLDASKCCNEVMDHCCINYKDVMEVLNKYNYQNYKKAWEELQETLSHYFGLEFKNTDVQTYMQELEQKHAIEVSNE